MATVYSLKNKAVTSFVQYNTNDDEMCSDSGDYVFQIDVSIEGTKLGASLSDNSITVCDSSSLVAVNKINGHSGTINGIEFSKTSPNMLYSCSNDKSVCLWDIRCTTSGPIIKVLYPEEVTGMSVSISDSLLAAGVESSVVFHDIRGCSIAGNAKGYRQLGSYADAHSDVITQLQFSKQHPQLLTSASEDGLLCVFNTAAVEQEEAIISVLNTECPIRKFGYFGGDDDGIYALSTIETASIWHHPSAQRLANFSSIRDDLTMNYLIDCVYSADSDVLWLLAGDYSGSAVISRLEPSGATVVGQLPADVGHVSTVRCCSLVASGNGNIGSSNSLSCPTGRLFTGGEDSRICQWSASSTVPAASCSSNNSGSGSLKASKKSSNAIRHSPY